MNTSKTLACAFLAFAFLASTAPLTAQQTVGGGHDEVPVGWPKADIRPGMSDAEVVAALGRYVDRAAAQDLFSGVVLLARDGKPLLEKAVGLADPARKQPVRIDTKFNLGSMNKIFTQVAIAQLAQAGKLSPSDTIRKHLPDYPSPVADKITIEQLVRHTSGLGDFFGPKFLAAPPSSIRRLPDYLALFADKPLEFEPGAKQRYSNAGYIVLGLIIERITGQSYYDYVQKSIAKPLGMRDTESLPIDAEVPNLAVGLTMRGPEGRRTTRQDNRGMLPGRGSSAGGGYSTAGDLLKFSQALLHDRLLNATWTNWIFQAAPSAQPRQRNLAIAGGSPGVNGTLLIEPPYTVVVLSNFDPPTAMQVGRAAGAMLGKGETPRKAPARGHPDAGAEGPGEVLLHGPATVPMTIEQHLPVIEAMINGKGPYRLAIDSGFGGMIEVSQAVAEKLGLPVMGEVIAGDPSGRNSRTMSAVAVDSIDIGSVHLGEIQGAISNGAVRSNVDAVIGLSLFKSLVVTFDYPHSAFAIRGGSLPAADGTSVLDYDASQGVPNIEIDVAGQKVKADIDSGSPAEVSLPLSVAKSLTLDDEPKVVGHARTGSKEFDVYGAGLKGDLHVGSIVLRNPRVDFVEIFPVGNLGFRFLGGRIVSFDPANHRVQFANP